MSDDEADPELLELLRAHILGKPSANADPETGVLEGAEYVYDNSIDVALDMWSCKTAANAIYKQMQEKSYSTATWSEHELHPKAKDEATVDFIFTMDLLNFSFWSELPDDKRFAVSYKDRTWTGYWSLVAALQRALDEAANGSAAGLVNLLADDFACFRDETKFEGRRKPVRFLKRAQILVADIWACFQGEDYGAFRDIDKITMFADYRVPQILSTMGCIFYSPTLNEVVKEKKIIESGSSWEAQLRDVEINAILIDFFLYDLMKDLESRGQETITHHRTRSIWY
ncbi:hypothetical protein SLS64_000292 [Diaporthe eres]